MPCSISTEPPSLVWNFLLLVTSLIHLPESTAGFQVEMDTTFEGHVELSFGFPDYNLCSRAKTVRQCCNACHPEHIGVENMYCSVAVVYVGGKGLIN